MEKKYVVIVDSMADFEIGFSDPNLVIVNTPVTIGGDDYTDATPDEFYKRQKEVFQLNNQLRRSGKCPIPIKTSTPSPMRLYEEMKKILETGRDAIYVATASTLTSAYQSGRIAVDMIEDDDEKYDGRAIAIDGLSMSALTAVMVRIALRDCDTTDDFIRFIFDRRNDTEHFFLVTEWDAFRDSGRIPPGTLAIATLAGFKPLMRFDFNDEGTRKAFAEKKHRNLRKLCQSAISTLAETIEEKFCMIIHANNPDGASLMHELLINQLPGIVPIYNLERCRMGPATGVHLGHSAIGLAFMRKKGVYENAELHRKTQLPEEAIYGYSFG
ncbi:DegV family EDD domain-containing protein [Candidatus Saccharibacteria bacterium]|nr:DegV family EDD domain-containing protein [Candidatus Saccharibacteria bacterium]